MNKALEMAKQEIKKMSDSDIKRAYEIFLKEDNKMGTALAIDEMQERHPKLFDELYNDETFEIDEMKFIDKAIARD